MAYSTSGSLIGSKASFPNARTIWPQKSMCSTMVEMKCDSPAGADCIIMGKRSLAPVKWRIRLILYDIRCYGQERGNFRRGEPMIDRLRDIACALLALLVLGVAAAGAQSSQSSTSSDSAAAPQVASTKGTQAAAQAAGPAPVHITTAEVTAPRNP